VPVQDDARHFEFLILDAFQAGLSWLTILKKRSNFREAFRNFNVKEVAEFDARDVGRLLSEKGIIRNRLKIEAAISNARAFLRVQQKFGSFNQYVWSYVDHRPIINSWSDISEIPSRTPLSDRMSHDLKSMGFKFVGSTICYAYMQAAGLINDHETGCFRYHEVASG
jgi:DNA-3-methyladenine glycosylase I